MSKKEKKSFFQRLFGKKESKKTETLVEHEVVDVVEGVEETEETPAEIQEVREQARVESVSEAEDKAEIIPSQVEVEPVTTEIVTGIKTERSYGQIVESIVETASAMITQEECIVEEEVQEVEEPKAVEEFIEPVEEPEEPTPIAVEEPVQVPVEQESTQEVITPAEEVEPVVEVIQQEPIVEEVEVVENSEEDGFTTITDIINLVDKYNGIIVDGLTVFNKYGEEKCTIKPLQSELIKDYVALKGIHAYFGSVKDFNQVEQIRGMIGVKDIHVIPCELAGNLVFAFEMTKTTPGEEDIVKAMAGVLLANCPCLSCISNSVAKRDSNLVTVNITFDTSKMTDALGVRLYSMSKVIKKIEEGVK